MIGTTRGAEFPAWEDSSASFLISSHVITPADSTVTVTGLWAGAAAIRGAGTRLLDATPIVDYLYACINQTIEVGLKVELDLLHKFRQVKQTLDREMDISNVDLDRFMNFCHQNNGHLSLRKRQRFFEKYSNEQISRMEEVYRSYINDSAEEN